MGDMADDWTPDEPKQITEVTFEVTIRHFVGDGDPNPTEDGIRETLVSQFDGNPYDLESISVERI